MSPIINDCTISSRVPDGPNLGVTTSNIAWTTIFTEEKKNCLQLPLIRAECATIRFLSTAGWMIHPPEPVEFFPVVLK